MSRLRVLRVPYGAAPTRHSQAVGLEGPWAKCSWKPQILSLCVATQQGSVWLVDETYAIDGNSVPLCF